MKKHIVFFFVSLLFCVNTFSQSPNITGLWEGKLNIGVDVRIVFHFIKNNDSTYSAKMDSPDQSVKGLPCSDFSIVGDSIKIEIKVAHGTFDGEIKNDSTINGAWVQNPVKLPLILKRVLEVAKLVRPQTPLPPFPYNSDSVEYDNADKSVHFGATFTYPKSGGSFPTAVLITGSGSQDRDETMFEHKPFAVIADYLTRKGYAVLRVDDRGMGLSTGEVKKATSGDFAKDVEAALTYLKKRKEVNKNKIGLIGHSEGGLIASLVAAQNPGISFIIMLAGPGLKGTVLLADQNEAIEKVEGISKKAAAAYKPFNLQILNDVLNSPDTATAIAEAWKQYLVWKKTVTPGELTELNVGSDSDMRRSVSVLVKQASIPWFKYFLRTDPAKYIKQLTCKVLALDGSKDIQVVPEPNLDAIKSALQKSSSKEFQTKQLPGLNHLFQHCTKCTVQEYGELTETFAPEALATMGDWLDKNIKN